MMQIGVSPKIEYLRVLHVLFECVIDVQQREVVTIDVGKSGLESGVSKRDTASRSNNNGNHGSKGSVLWGGQKGNFGGPNRPKVDYQH